MEINKEIINKYPWGIKWDRRARMIARFIGAKYKVLDIGGGLGNLNNYLINCDYTSIDLEKWTDKTVVADLNKEFPKLPLFDIIVCQGIIEYITDPVSFLNNIKQYGEELVISYRLKGGETPMPRNNFSFNKFEALLEKTKWRCIVKKSKTKSENIYLCKRD